MHFQYYDLEAQKAVTYSRVGAHLLDDTIYPCPFFDSNSMTQALAMYGNMLDLRPLFADANAFWAEGLSYLKSNLSIICLMGVAALISFLRAKYAPDLR